MTELLKGNFKVKKSVDSAEGAVQETFQEKYRKRALASIGGSMVFIERATLVWDGD